MATVDAYHQNRTSEIYGVTISLMVAATMAVVFRLVARSLSAAGLWWDDFAIAVATVSVNSSRRRTFRY